MKALLLACLLLAPAAARGEDAASVVLWVPPESFTEWTAVSKAFDAYPALRLTIALTPEMSGRRAEVLLARWVEEGRLELAMRLKGDPVLPLIALQGEAPRPQDVVHRLAAAKERFRLTFSSTPPSGFVPGGGTFSPELLGAFKAMGLGWAAYGAAAPLRSGPAPVLVPFTPIEPSAEPKELLAPGPTASVVDEAAGLAPAGLMLQQLVWLSVDRPRRRWLTVSQALAEAPPSSDAPAAGTWAEGLYTMSPAQQAAWAAYGRTAAALKRYQNSGAADLKALDDATEALYAAQAGTLYRALAVPGRAADADRKLRAAMASVYRKMRQPVPGGLSKAMTVETLGEDAAPAPQEEPSGDLAVTQTADSLAFKNPPAAGKPPALRSLKISWSAEELALAYEVSAQALKDLRLDTYIDINGQPGAGSSTLLDGVNAYAQNRDAWEYAVTAGPDGAKLYRSTPGGTPVELAQGTVSVQATGSVRVVFPRPKLPGNPARWGYIALLVAPGQPEPLSVLAPSQLQKAAVAGGKRLSAIRAH